MRRPYGSVQPRLLRTCWAGQAAPCSPLTLNGKRAAVSLGCAGNRLYTGLPEDELYIAIPGDSWEAFTSKIAEIVAANARMAEHYRDHEQSLKAPS